MFRKISLLSLPIIFCFSPCVIADFTLNLSFLGTGNGVVQVTDSSSSMVLNVTSNASSTLPLGDYTVSGTPTSISLAASTMYAGTGDMTVSTTYSRESVFQSLDVKKNSSTEFVLGSTYNISSPANLDVFDITYTFNAVGNTNVQEYQYFFTSTPGAFALGAGDLVVFSANPTIQNSVFSSLGPGTHTAYVRVVDGQNRFADTSFDFTISPSGGLQAIPEPSSFVLVGLVGLGILGKRIRNRKINGKDLCKQTT